MEDSVAIETVMDKLPTSELDKILNEFVSPFTEVMPDARLKEVVPLVVRGIVAGESPLLTRMAQNVARTQSTQWAAAKRIYRFLGNPRLSAGLLAEGLYRCSRRTIEGENPEYLVVAVDPVNLEKPYTQELEGLSTVYKSTPPDRHGSSRLARGYPAITATVVNTRVAGHHLRRLLLLHHRRLQKRKPGDPPRYRDYYCHLPRAQGALCG